MQSPLESTFNQPRRTGKAVGIIEANANESHSSVLTFKGEVLVNGQVGGQGPDSGAIGGRCGGRFGEARLGLAPTCAAPALCDMLGDHEGDVWEVEDLTAFDVDDRGAGEPRSARVARPGHVGDDLIGVGHTWARCFPSVPGCFPGLRLPAPRRSARDGGLEKLSADGGIDELRGVRPRRSSRSAILASSFTMTAAWRSVTSRSAASCSLSSS